MTFSSVANWPDLLTAHHDDTVRPIVTDAATSCDDLDRGCDLTPEDLDDPLRCVSHQLDDLRRGFGRRARVKWWLGVVLDLDRIVAGDYQLELAHWRDGTSFDGLIVSVEGESTVATSHASLGDGSGSRTDIARLGPAGTRNPGTESGRASEPPAPGSAAQPRTPSLRK